MNLKGCGHIMATTGNDAVSVFRVSIGGYLSSISAGMRLRKGIIMKLFAYYFLVKIDLMEYPSGYRLYYSWSLEYDRRANLLHLSSRNGWLDVTKELITKYQFNPREGDALGNTCLHYAAEGNQVDIVRYLVNECNCDPMTSIEYGHTVLHTAARYGSLVVMKYLINHCHCNPMITNQWGETVFCHAVRHIDVVKYLINKCNCDPMATNSYISGQFFMRQLSLCQLM